MQTVSSPFLRRVLQLDTVATGATGLLMAFGAQITAPLTGLEPALVQPLGVFLIAYTGFVGWIAAKRAFPGALIWTVIAINAAWVAGSLLFLVMGWAGLTAIGIAFVIAQAVAVAGFAELQFVGLRKATPVQPAAA